jgi:hypothetical protein
MTIITEKHTTCQLFNLYQYSKLHTSIVDGGNQGGENEFHVARPYRMEFL